MSAALPPGWQEMPGRRAHVTGSLVLTSAAPSLAPSLDAHACRFFCRVADLSLEESPSPRHRRYIRKAILCIPIFHAPRLTPSRPLPAPSPLPLDPSTGKKFYYHAGTGKRQWDFPTSASANVPTELPPGWQKHYDPNTGRAFYLNPITGKPQVRRSPYVGQFCVFCHLDG